MERYFYVYSISDSLKLPLAAICFDDDAGDWFRWLYHTNQFRDWDDLVDKLFIQFRSRTRAPFAVNRQPPVALKTQPLSCISSLPLTEFRDELVGCTNKTDAHKLFVEISDRDTDVETEDTMTNDHNTCVTDGGKLPTAVLSALVDGSSNTVAISEVPITMSEIPVDATLLPRVASDFEDENSAHENQVFAKISHLTETLFLKPIIYKELSLVSYGCLVNLMSSVSANSQYSIVANVHGEYILGSGDSTLVAPNNSARRLDITFANKVYDELSTREHFDEICAPHLNIVCRQHGLDLHSWVDMGQRKIVHLLWDGGGHIDTPWGGITPTMCVLDKSNTAKVSTKSDCIIASSQLDGSTRISFPCEPGATVLIVPSTLSIVPPGYFDRADERLLKQPQVLSSDFAQVAAMETKNAAVTGRVGSGALLGNVHCGIDFFTAWFPQIQKVKLAADMLDNAKSVPAEIFSIDSEQPAWDEEFALIIKQPSLKAFEFVVLGCIVVSDHDNLAYTTFDKLHQFVVFCGMILPVSSFLYNNTVAILLLLSLFPGDMISSMHTCANNENNLSGEMVKPSVKKARIPFLVVLIGCFLEGWIESEDDVTEVDVNGCEGPINHETTCMIWSNHLHRQLAAVVAQLRKDKRVSMWILLQQEKSKYVYFVPVRFVSLNPKRTCDIATPFKQCRLLTFYSKSGRLLFQSENNGRIVIFDPGGGTFNVPILDGFMFEFNIYTLGLAVNVLLLTLPWHSKTSKGALAFTHSLSVSSSSKLLYVGVLNTHQPGFRCSLKYIFRPYQRRLAIYMISELGMQFDFVEASLVNQSAETTCQGPTMKSFETSAVIHLSMFDPLAVELVQIDLLDYSWILIATVHGVPSSKGCSSMTKEQLFAGYLVCVFPIKWLPPWSLETSLAFCAIYRKRLLWTHEDHLFPTPNVENQLISHLSLLEGFAKSAKASPSGLTKILTRSILILLVSWYFDKLEVLLALGSLTVEAMNSSPLLIQNNALQPYDGIHKLYFTGHGLPLKVKWLFGTYLVSIMFDPLLYLNLEDKVLNSVGGIVMNSIMGLKEQQDSKTFINRPGLDIKLWLSPSTRQPNPSLIWDPG